MPASNALGKAAIYTSNTDGQRVYHRRCDQTGSEAPGAMDNVTGNDTTINQWV